MADGNWLEDAFDDTKDWFNRNLLDRSGVSNIALNVTSGGLWELGKTLLHQKGGSSDVPKDFYNTPNYRGYTYDSKGNVIGLAPEKTPYRQLGLPNAIDAYYNDSFPTPPTHGEVMDMYHNDDFNPVPDRSGEPLPYQAFDLIDKMKTLVDTKNAGYNIKQGMTQVMLKDKWKSFYTKYRDEGLDHDTANQKAWKMVSHMANAVNSTISDSDDPMLPDNSPFYNPDDDSYIIRPDPTNPDNGNKGDKDSGGDGSEIMNFLSNLLAGNSSNVESGIVPGIDDFIDNSHELNEIQMLAMKVKSLNPTAAKELWNMSNLPKQQILEVYHFRYELSLASPINTERRKSRYVSTKMEKRRKPFQKRKAKRFQGRYA